MSVRSSSAKSPSSFAKFEPHVTLASIPSGVDASSLLDAIPGGATAIPVRFKSLEVGEKYFMSVYVTVHESPELEKLRKHLRRALGEKAVPPIPHLSLYYIDDADVGDRAWVAKILQSTGRTIKTTNGITLNCIPVSGDEPLSPGQNDPSLQLLEGFEGAEIWAVKCEGHPRDWKILHKFTLPRR